MIWGRVRVAVPTKLAEFIDVISVSTPVEADWTPTPDIVETGLEVSVDYRQLATVTEGYVFYFHR
jgi:hypothetical protein